jgi:hypothetical protein
MNEPPTWTSLEKNIRIKAQPADGIWQTALDYVQGPLLLKIVANGTWTYSSKFAGACSPNGDVLSPLDNKGCIYEKAPVGALIGRIGGSIASKEPEGVFVVGSFCVRKLDAASVGPLFLTINDKWNGFGDNEGEITVEIEFASSPAEPATASSG